MRQGSDLYRLVCEYADLGEHRTGTAVDRATTDWLAGLLRGAGAAVEFQPFEFSRYQAEWEVRVDGEPVQSIPLFYEGIGLASTNHPATMSWKPGLSHTGLDPAFDAFARQALADGAPAAVVATGGPTGLLHAVNRAPILGSGLPTLLVPGRLGDRLGSARVEVTFDARILTGRSNNIIGRFGDGPIEETLVITTPISGWFRCAGERGTGIAVAIEVAAAIAQNQPVMFIGASGHELYHQGAQRAVREIAGPPQAIVHIGASVAAAAQPPVNGSAILTPDLVARISADLGQSTELSAVLAEVGIRTVVPQRPNDPEEWTGESRNWAHFNRPLFSLVGGFPFFHAPEDTPERATTPALLEKVSHAVATSVRLMVT